MLASYSCKWKRVIVLLFLMLSFVSVKASHADGGVELKIGVLAHKGGDAALKTWSPLAAYLNNKLSGYHFHIVSLDLSETHEAVKNKRVDFILTNPGNYIALEKLYGISALATLKKSYRSKDIDSFGAVIFTRRDNESINKLTDLKGKIFMGVKPGAFGGFQMAWRELKNKNIDPFTEIKELQFSGFPQTAVVMAVKNKLVDAGTVRTGILEMLAAKGKINLDYFKILNGKENKYFPFLLSTDLYPEWPFSRLPHIENKVAAIMYAALSSIPDDLIKSGRVNIAGWTKPNDYQSVHDLMQLLNVGPYKNERSFSSVVFFKKYLVWITLSLVVIALMIMFMVHVMFLNRKILFSKRELENKIEESIVLEQSLLQEKTFLSAILNNISDGVVACNDEGRIILMNNAALDITGLDYADVKGQPWFSSMDFYQSNGVSLINNVDNPFNQVLDKNVVQEQDFVYKRLDDNRNLLINGQAIVNDKGKKAGIVLSMHDITERLVNERRLKSSEKELRSILDNMQDTYYRTNLAGEVIGISRSIENFLGYSLEEALGKKLSSMYVDPDGRNKFISKLNESGGRIQNYQATMFNKAGDVVWVSTSAHYHFDEDGDIDGIEGVTRDITALKNAEALLFQEKERAHITLQSIGDGVITMGMQGEILYINPYAEQMIGCSHENAVSRPLKTYVHFSDAVTKVPLDDPIEKCLMQKEVFEFTEHIHAVRNDGTYFSVKLTVSPLHDMEGSIKGVVMVIHDVSEMWKLAQQLSYQASHDALTGLINRREFDRQLEVSLRGSQKTGSQHTLCYMDLDQFKIVNDTCGHIAGDRLLKQLSQVLVNDVRDNDIFARLGGDEFGLLLEGCSLDKAELIVEKIRKTVKEFRFSWEDKNFELGISIGIVPVTKDSASITELLSEADAACYVAKGLGRNRVHKYHYGDTELVKHKSEMQWVSRIQSALDEDRFVIYCQTIQPILCENRRYSEVLVRMLDENGDVILPGAFIPAAERFCLMSDIDRKVIQKVLVHLQNMSVNEDAYFTINLSGQSVGDESMLNFIVDNINKYKIDPSLICFEITETAAVANLDSARIFIDRLHELGCQFSLDDFGSGLSSFTYLKNLDVDFLKIDGSFVRDIAHDPVDYAMVSSINQIGHLMGIKTIAEFVEDKDILDRLKSIGVDFVQGYYIDTPHPLVNLTDNKQIKLS